MHHPNRMSWAQVSAAFQNHIDHYVQKGGGENALIGLRAEGAVTLQYAGRVVLELLQNAIDKAEERVVVQFTDDTLLVGNDGEPLTVDPDFDYQKPETGERRSDFNALCALHTSNKSPERQFGNKGIGFRSVFGVSPRVEVWSRLKNGGWWGLELAMKRRPDHWSTEAIPELNERVQALGSQPRPSFHLPRPLRSDSLPVPVADERGDQLETVVLLRVSQPSHQKQIAHEIARLTNTRFQFVGLRKKNLRIELVEELRSTDSGWAVKADHQFEDLHELALAAEHDVDAPRMSIAWRPEPKGISGPSATADPDENLEEVEQIEAGVFYNYLPTRMSTGLPMDVHGDFQVKADRESMNLGPDNPVGRYNLALLRKAAEAHLETLREEASRERPRLDFWTLANRPSDAPDAWTYVLRHRLFSDDHHNGRYGLWLDLAEAFFGGHKPALKEPSAVSTFRQFWEASQRWLHSIMHSGPWTKTWSKEAERFCQLLAEREIPVLPVPTAGAVSAVPLPSRQARGQRAERRVFFWPPSREDEDLPDIPEALLEQGRSVTRFKLGYWEEPSGVSRFEPTEVLRDLRQLPNNLIGAANRDSQQKSETNSSLASTHPGEESQDDESSDWMPTGYTTPEVQGALLRFARELLQRETTEGRHFAWRAFSDTEDRQRMGRSIATLFLPSSSATTDSAGAWLPARQLSMDQVDAKLLQRITGLSDNALRPFLRVLGVAPDSALPLVEGGDAGAVQALPNPPALCAPGGPPIPPLKPILGHMPTLEAVYASLSELPPDNERSQVHHTIWYQPWLAPERFRTHEGLPPLSEHFDRIAPAQVSLAIRDVRSIFLAVPEDEEDINRLRPLGALERIDSEEAGRRAPLLIQGLKKRFPNPGQMLSAGRLTRLVALVDTLMQRMPLHDSPGTEALPVLIEQRGKLRWRLGDACAGSAGDGSAGDDIGDPEPCWLARREERNELRRFFPDLPLVAGTWRKGLADAIGASGEVRLQTAVRGEVKGDVSRVAVRIYDTIDAYLHVFCAIASQSGRVQEVDVPRIQRGWKLRHPDGGQFHAALRQLEDAWLELSVEGPEHPAVPWRKGKYEDVFYQPGESGEPGVIVFDTHRSDRHRSAGDNSNQREALGNAGPPLRHFGNALAQLLVNNVVLGPSFAEVLTVLDGPDAEREVDDYLERHHLHALAQQWQNDLVTLSKPDREKLIESLREVVLDPEEVYHRGLLRKSDLDDNRINGLNITTTSQLENRLNTGLPGGLQSHLPRVVIESEHEGVWREWWRRYQKKLKSWLKHNAEFAETTRQRASDEHGPGGDALSEQALDDEELGLVFQALGRHARSRLQQLDFHPETAVLDSLQNQGLKVELDDLSLESALDSFVPIFSSVRGLDVSGDRWRVGTGSHGSTTGGPERKLSSKDVLDEQTAKAAWGDAAEQAFLGWVISNVRPFLMQHQNRARDTLLSAFREGSLTRQRVADAFERNDLEDALHVARHWSGAGFDVIGLRSGDDGNPLLVRYECKGLPTSASRIRVYLSRRELAVARKVRRNDASGDWLLVGVEPDGQAVDLTGRIESVLDEESVLDGLYERGLEPDGLRVVLERG